MESVLHVARTAYLLNGWSGFRAVLRISTLICSSCLCALGVLPGRVLQGLGDARGFARGSAAAPASFACSGRLLCFLRLEGADQQRARGLPWNLLRYRLRARGGGGGVCARCGQPCSGSLLQTVFRTVGQGADPRNVWNPKGGSATLTMPPAFQRPGTVSGRSAAHAVRRC